MWSSNLGLGHYMAYLTATSYTGIYIHAVPLTLRDKINVVIRPFYTKLLKKHIQKQLKLKLTYIHIHDQCNTCTTHVLYVVPCIIIL